MEMLTSFTPPGRFQRSISGRVAYRAEEMQLSIRRLHRADLPIDTAKLARFLIGKTLVHDLPEGRLSGRIVETEAYVVGDAAGHAFRGRTRRNRSLFLERGHAYVYLAYGLHTMLNVTSEVSGVGAGVLLRALEPLDGIPLMRLRRAQAPLIDLARGPGRLAQAMGIGLRDDGLDLCAVGPLWLGDSVRPVRDIGRSVRIGISRETQRLLRFYERASPYISGPERSTA
jgi:DNA-3-methyladenine glycosylase